MPHMDFSFLKLFKPLCNEGMWNDLLFYLDHETELYFGELFLIAVSHVVFAIFLICMAIRFSFDGEYVLAFICIGIAAICDLGFAIIKFYLHIRKDLIEINERINN